MRTFIAAISLFGLSESFFQQSFFDLISNSKRLQQFSNSYIPAAVQVLVHVVNQLDELPKENVVRRNHSVAIVHTEHEGSVLIEYSNQDGRSLVEQRESQRKLRKLISILNKEAKLKNLEKYQGFSSEMLKHLADSSKSSAAKQLTELLIKSRNETTTVDLHRQINATLFNINNNKSNLSDDLKLIQPLNYLDYES